jgi:hypothetical protein
MSKLLRSAPVLFALVAIGAPPVGAAASAGRQQTQTPAPKPAPQTPVLIPKPFPQPNEPLPPATLPQTPTPPSTSSSQPGAAMGPGAATTSPEIAQLEATLGVKIYPTADFLESFDAGKGGQHYYLFGTDATYPDIVNYYKSVLQKGGRTLFQAPAMYQFDLGDFDDKTMAFQPSVVVKDYTWLGSDGYLFVKGTTQHRYRTIIQVVPAPRPGGTP